MCLYVCSQTVVLVCRSENTVKESHGFRLGGGEHLYFLSHLASPGPTHRILLSLRNVSNLYSLTFQFSLSSNWWKSRLLFLYSLFSLAPSLSLCVTYKMVTNSKGSLNLVKFHTGASKRQSLSLFAKADNIILCFPFCDFYVFTSTY